MIKATYESANFTFTAYGQNAEDAINTLKGGLNQHAADYDLNTNWWHAYEADICIEHIELNKTYRDSELLKG